MSEKSSRNFEISVPPISIFLELYFDDFNSFYFESIIMFEQDDFYARRTCGTHAICMKQKRLHADFKLRFLVFISLFFIFHCCT